MLVSQYGTQTILDMILMEVQEEVIRAQKLHSPMRSAHEGYAVLLEEVDELWDEVKHKKPDKRLMRKEAIQVAAMGIRFVSDVA